jgi:putative zinc finger/helix-turn-helix YgiT family protein
MTDRCLHCGEQSVSERIAPYFVEHSGQTREFSDPQMKCSNCGNVSYVGSQISAHERAIADAIRDIDGLLRGDQLFAIRAKYKLRQTDMEKILSTGSKTWTRWERGKVPHSKSTDTLLRLMADDPNVAKRMMLDANIENPEAAEVFTRIDENAERLTRAVLRKELGPTADLERVLGAFAKVGDARRQAAAQMEAA